MKKLNIKKLIVMLMILFAFCLNTKVLAVEIPWDTFIANKGLCIDPGSPYRKNLGLVGHLTPRAYGANYTIRKRCTCPKYDDNTGELIPGEHPHPWHTESLGYPTYGFDVPEIDVKNYFNEAGSGQIDVRMGKDNRKYGWLYVST